MSLARGHGPGPQTRPFNLPLSIRTVKGRRRILVYQRRTVWRGRHRRLLLLPRHISLRCVSHKPHCSQSSFTLGDRSIQLTHSSLDKSTSEPWVPAEQTRSEKRESTIVCLALLALICDGYCKTSQELCPNSGPTILYGGLEFKTDCITAARIGWILPGPTHLRFHWASVTNLLVLFVN